jgi:hypothetical protein
MNLKSVLIRKQNRQEIEIHSLQNRASRFELEIQSVFLLIVVKQ